MTMQSIAQPHSFSAGHQSQYLYIFSINIHFNQYVCKYENRLRGKLVNIKKANRKKADKKMRKYKNGQI